MELRLAERQGAEIRVLAPDEPDARAAFEEAHPDKVHDRKASWPLSSRPFTCSTTGTSMQTLTRARGRTRDGCGHGGGNRRAGEAAFDGPVSAALEADLRSWVRRDSIVVWLDQAGLYGEFVERLQELRGAACFRIRSWPSGVVT